MDVKWVKIRSWHAVARAALSRDPAMAGYLWATQCGRLAHGVPVDELPAGHSCENCLRIVARKADA